MLRLKFNRIYDENETIEEIRIAQENELDKLENASESAFLDNFIMTAGIQGIRNYEQILDIAPDTINDTIEFRRGRIINRLSSMPPFTEIFLRQKLNTIFGSGRWSLVVDHAIYTIFIDVDTRIRNLFQQTISDIRQIVPANMILFTKQVLVHAPQYVSAVAVAPVFSRRRFITNAISRG